jgi:CubicO group peptidase (beta-lactamase class C family)
MMLPPPTRLGGLLALLVLALAAQAPAQEPIPAELAGRIGALFGQWDRTDSPGCVVGVGRDGRTIYGGAFGMANLEHDVRLTPASVVEIGSVSKQFATAAIVLLAQEGRLSLEDDVRRWVPELPDFGRPITIRHLATHTSGLRDQWGLLGLMGRGPGSQVHDADLVVELLSRQRDLNFPPGDQYLYSNSGYTLLGVIVERASGRTLAEFSRERLFGPLGMTATEWRDDHRRVVKGRAFAYSPALAGFRTEMPFTNIYGNGGLLTTIGDLAIWMDALFTGRVGGEGFTELLLTRGRLNDGLEIGYALGINVGEHRGRRELGHGGATAGYRAHLLGYPEDGLSVAVLCNLASIAPAGLARQVAELFLPAAEEKAAPAAAPYGLSATEAAERAGLYRNHVTEELLRIEAAADKLFLAGVPRSVELVPTGPLELRPGGSGAELRFEPPVDGGPGLLRRRTADGDPGEFLRVAPAQPSAASLAAFAGEYHSPELEYGVTILQGEDGGLLLRRRLMSDVRLVPTFEDGFAAGGGAVVFRRDGEGRVTGFAYTAGRIRHVRFDRR